MEPIIREENNIYAVGYSYEADWRKLCRVKDRAAYWSRIDFSNMDKAAYGGIENKCGMEIAFWLCKETGDFEMRFFFGERVEPVANVPDGMEMLEIPAAKYAIFTLDSQGDTLSQDAYVQAIRDLWQYIFKEWFPGSGYRHDDEKCNFEVYSGTQQTTFMEVRTMNIKNQIKAQIMFAGFTMAEVVDALSTEYGWSDSLSNFSAKLSRESLRYKEAQELAEVLGYEIVWKKKGAA